MLEEIKISNNYVFKKLEDHEGVKYYALNTLTGDCYEINETAYDILSIMQQYPAMEEVLTQLRIMHKDLEKEVFEKDYQELIKTCVELGIIVYV